jgi:hypothetical protein
LFGKVGSLSLGMVEVKVRNYGVFFKLGASAHHATSGGLQLDLQGANIVTLSGAVDERLGVCNEDSGNAQSDAIGVSSTAVGDDAGYVHVFGFLDDFFGFMDVILGHKYAQIFFRL